MLNECYHKKQKRLLNDERFDVYSHNNSIVMPEKSIHNDTGHSVLNKELSKVIEASVQKLAEDYRLTFTLRELSGLSVAETADILQTTPTNIKVRLNRAKMMLRKEIEKNYSTEDIFEFNLVYCDRIVSAVMKKIRQINSADHDSA
jgi:RNA polymerase sigma-70 factor (ECF subfamily)